MPRKASRYHVDDPVKVGARLRDARLAAGLSQRELTRRLIDVSPAYVCRVESGQRTPSLQVIVQVADALGVSPEWLARGTGPTAAPAARALRALQMFDGICSYRGAATDIRARALLVVAMDVLGGELGRRCTGKVEGPLEYDHSDGTCPVHEWIDEADGVAVSRLLEGGRGNPNLRPIIDRVR